MTYQPFAHTILTEHLGGNGQVDRSYFLDTSLARGHAPRAVAKGGSVRAAVADVARLFNWLAKDWTAQPPRPHAHVYAALGYQQWSERVRRAVDPDDPIQLGIGEQVDTIWAWRDQQVRRRDAEILQGIAEVYDVGAQAMRSIGAESLAGLLGDYAAQARNRARYVLQGSAAQIATGTVAASLKDYGNIVGTAGRGVGLPFPTMPGTAAPDPHKWDRLQTLIAAGALAVTFYTAWPAIAGTRRALARWGRKVDGPA